MIQTEEWGRPDDGGQRTADLLLQIKGQPAKMVGTASILDTGNGIEMQIQGDLKVAIPFVGKKVEPEIAKAIYAAADKEQKAADARLS